MVTKENIAIIPARGGSKRIPRKNIIEFCGKPLIAWTIEAAKKSGIFDKIFVSTDDDEIAEISKSFGAEVPFLRDKYADSFSNSSDALLYSLDQIETKLKEKYKTVFHLLPNCPIRNSNNINEAYNYFLKSNGVFQISCFKFGWMNPWWAARLDQNLKPDFLYPQGLKTRSQDLDDLYCPTGAVWIANVEKLKETKTFYSQPLAFFPMNWKSAVDIDNYEDLEMAKAIYLIEQENKVR